MSYIVARTAGGSGLAEDAALATDDAAALLRHALRSVTPGRLILTTSFGPGGLVLLHMLRRMEVRLPVVFVDTLHHFRETLRFAREMERRWALDLRVYRPAITRRCFEEVHGPELWARDVDRFHRLTKVEPLRSALIGVEGWITGRRRDQSAERASLASVEPGEPLKVNPLVRWSRADVWGYIDRWDVPYNPLHDQGFASVGDAPLTTRVGAGEDERAGRWRGLDRSECGIHELGGGAGRTAGSSSPDPSP